MACRRCGSIIPSHRRTGAIFCSEPCRVQWHRGRLSEARASRRATLATVPCEVCGLPVGYHHRSRARTYHPECRHHAEYARYRRKILDYSRSVTKRQVRSLDDTYIRRLLGLGVAAAPRDLIDAKRLQLQVHRLTTQEN